MIRIQRRRLLQLAVGGIAAAASSQRDRTRDNASDTEPTDDIREFDPSIHGFGFANWSGDAGTGADGREFTYEPRDVTFDRVQRAIDESWTDTLSYAEKAILTRIVYSWIGSGAATNGHCYGMVYAAEGYYWNRWELPAGVDAASDLSHPTEAYEAVGDRIRWLQTSQLLHAELTWYALLGLRWGLADHRESLGLVTDSIDTADTCGLALEGEAGAHQVLAFGYEERPDGVVDVSVYDPNYGAAEYEGSGSDSRWMLSVAPETGRVDEIKDGYEQFVYHDPEMDLPAIDRLVGGRDQVFEELSNAVFFGLRAGETLEIDVPDDVFVDRPVAEYADQERAPYADAAVVFEPPDEFGISIEGDEGVEYSLDTLGLRDGDLALEERISGTLAEVPARLRFTADEAGELVVNAVEEGTEAAEEGAREAVDQSEEAVNETEEAVNETEEAVNETEEVVGRTEAAAKETSETAEQAENATENNVTDPPGRSNGRTGWLEDNWPIAAGVGGGALGLGAVYRYLTRRSDGEGN